MSETMLKSMLVNADLQTKILALEYLLNDLGKVGDEDKLIMMNVRGKLGAGNVCEIDENPSGNLMRKRVIAKRSFKKFVEYLQAARVFMNHYRFDTLRFLKACEDEAEEKRPDTVGMLYDIGIYEGRNGRQILGGRRLR